MKTIMLVEDSNLTRTMLKKQLSQTYQIIEAANGREALLKMKTAEIDLFLLDIYMPFLDGLALLKIIKNTTKFRDIPVIMVTVETNKKIWKRAKKKGASGWIVKPFEMSVLLEAIKKII